MTAAELAQSAEQEAEPPQSLSPLAKALWYAHKCGADSTSSHWQQSHEIVQDIHTSLGSWTHALLHLMEGDQWNADYWFNRASKPSRKPAQISALWQEIAAAVLS